MKLRSQITLVAINAAVLVGILLACEGGFRLYRAIFPVETAWFDPYLQAQPYVMFTNSPSMIYDRFPDGLHGGWIASHIAVNNYGFPEKEDFDLVTPRPKAPREKVVLITGGSVPWGSGATSNETIVHGQLEKRLNEAQHETKYTVINLAMRGWIAQQEATGLDLWGRLFDPDWIVTIDGGADAAMCTLGQGVGNPLSYQLMRFFIDGYMRQPRVPLFRGRWENELIRASALYRALTGEQYIAPPQNLDSSQADQRVLMITAPTKVSAIRQAEEFYLLSERSIIERFSHAKILLTTNPYSRPFEPDFGEFYAADGSIRSTDAATKFVQRAEETLNREAGDLMCNIKTGQIAINYFLATAPVRLDAIAASYRAQGRDVGYVNLGRVFPDEKEAREANFADQAHMKDGGHAIIARRIAEDILARDSAENH